MLKGLIAVGLALPYVLGAVQLAGAAPIGPLAQIIEGAKKERTVSARLAPSFTEKSMARLEREIKEKFGAELKIKFTPNTEIMKVIAEVIMERKAGAIPSYDLMTVMGSHFAAGMKGDVLERVDWKPLITEGTNPEVVLDTPQLRGAIVYYNAHFGLMYNPEKIKADEVPKTLSDLGNPKWKGRGGIETNMSSLLRWSFVLGKEKFLSSLRAIMKNGAIQGRYVDLMNRYLLGELSWCTNTTAFLKDVQGKGMPAAFQTLDFADVQEYSLAVVKGDHSNAAKLVAIYLASPEGAKFTIEEAAAGNLFYPGNREHDIRVKNQKQGVPEVIGDRRPGLLEFYGSAEGTQLQKEITLILQTGGER